jgi:ABC-type Fe3+-hydroxamate transport system substrate-binding protein
MLPRRVWLWISACLGVAAIAGAWAVLGAGPPKAPPVADSPTGARIVSLSPSITETLFYLGAGRLVVGVSDYCRYPDAAAKLPRVGTGLTPRYEAIARLAPTLIISEDNAHTRGVELQRLAKTQLLPWLELAEITASVRELGRITDQPEAAEALARRFETTLGVQPPNDAPRVLLVLGYDPGRLDEIWFIRKNSLHGRALHAAGAKNAVDRTVSGLPRLSLQHLIELDPDMVIVLLGTGTPQATLDAWQRLDALRAVRQHKISAVVAPEAFANSPRIFALVERLRAELQRLAARAPGG